MLTHLWRKNIGQSIIDIHVDSYSQTVSAGDRNGKTCIFDYYGNSIAEFEEEIQVWGVSHTSLDDGTILFSSGHANKARGTGLLNLYADDDLILRHETDEPIWDTCICSDLVLATGWHGGLYIFDILKGTFIEKKQLESSLFGLTTLSDGTALINAYKDGVYSFSSKDGLEKIISLENACYNIAYSHEGNFIVTGTRGPYMFVTNPNGVIRAKFKGEQIFAVSVFREFIITGDRAGDLSIWHVDNPSKKIYSSNQGASIWNISCDMKQGHIFLALEDGSISCLNLELDEQRLDAIKEFVSNAKKDKKVDIVSAIKEGVSSTVLTPFLIDALSENSISENQVRELIRLIEEKEAHGERGYGGFTKAILCFSIGDYQHAIDGFQIVDSSHPFYGMAIILLAKALIGLNNHDAARQYLVANISSLEERYAAQAVSILDGLGSDSGQGMVIVGENKPFAYKPLVGGHRQQLFSAVVTDEQKLQDIQSIDYGMINYIKYEYPNRADQIKKILEKSAVEQLLSTIDTPRAEKPFSLDIGCATCRYPLWLSSKGFYAVGYDIDDEAIKICKMRAEGHDDIHIEKKNILEHQPEKERYSLITCMMGTFNHIEVAEQVPFIRWIYESLRAGGAFIFSSWNKECPYTTHLHFYNREEREFIENNSLVLSEIEKKLIDVGFIVEKSLPISFLPDECYEAWFNDISEEQLVNLDHDFSNILTGRNAQLYVVCAVKV